MSPYRESDPPELAGGTSDNGLCPQCGAAFGTGDFPDCPRGCGTWIPASVFPSPPDSVGTALDAIVGAKRLPCPHCQQPLAWREWESMRFAVCADHGVFVELDYAERFGTRLISLHEQGTPQTTPIVQTPRAMARTRATTELGHEDTAVDELAESLTTPAGRRAFARRLLALEAEVAALRRERS